MIPIALINPLSVLLSLSTLFGIVMHDTKIDQFAVSALSMPSIVATYESGSSALKLGDAHTHTERISLSEVVRNMNAEAPRAQARNSELKKYMLQKNVARGHHGFDNYFLPIA